MDPGAQARLLTHVLQKDGPTLSCTTGANTKVVSCVSFLTPGCGLDRVGCASPDPGSAGGKEHSSSAISIRSAQNT